MKKRLLSILLICCMVLTLMPTTAFAADHYMLAVNDFWFSSDNLTYNGNSGTATYSPATKTLTLDNLNVTATSREGSVIYSEIPDLKIVVKGTNTITIPASLNDKTTVAVAIHEANTTISGSNASTDKLIVHSAGTNVTEAFSDGTTRAGIYTYNANLTIDKVTLQMNDTSATAYLGHSSLLYSQGALRVTNSVLQSSKCQHGIYANSGNVTVQNTTFALDNSSVSNSSGLNLAPDTTNTVTNSGGTIAAEYPLYTYGALTLGENTNKLTLNSSTFATTVKKDASAAKAGSVYFQNANVEMNGPTGIDLEDAGNVTVEGGTVTANVSDQGISVMNNGGTFTLNSGTVNLNGTSESAVGIYTYGTVNVKGGNLITSSVNCAIQQVGTNDIVFSGGTHTLDATAAGYANNASGGWNITNGSVTVNAPVGIQLTSGKKGGLTVSGGTLDLNCTSAGIDAQSGAGKTALSGGNINITDKNKDATISGIKAVGELEISGTANVTFTNCKYDILSQNKNNKISGGKVSLSGSYAGLFATGNFAVAGGEVKAEGNGYGILGAEGTVTLSGGTVTFDLGDYPIMAYQNCKIAFAGANVKASTSKNAGLIIYDDKSSYEITGGDIVLQSTQAGANKLYSSLASGYAVWAGSSAENARLISSPTLATLTNNKYVHITKNSAYTLTLENVKEGTTATHFAGETITYHANDPESGKHFSHWELTVGENTTNVGSESTYTGEMPAQNATLTAVYENCSGGTATCIKKAVCDTCGREYGDYGDHDHSASWSSDATDHWKVCGNCDETLDKAAHRFGDWKITKEATTTEKGEKERTCEVCEYVETADVPMLDAPRYEIQVTGGKALVKGTEVTKAAEEDTVTLRADTPASGQTFDQWVVVSGNVILADAKSMTTTFTMPKGEVSVKAVYKDIEYKIDVTDGKATVEGTEVARAIKGTTVTITADEPEEGKEFDKWEVISGEITLADETSATTTFTMPMSDVSVKAIYKEAFHEQFHLTVGETYWFDLSNIEIPGTTVGTLPDTTLKYVPFTYAGSVEAYVLNSASSGVMGSSNQAAESTQSDATYGYRYLHSLFVANSDITHNLSWNALNDAGLIFGKNYVSGSVNYSMRAMTMGSESGTSDQNSEWYLIKNKNEDYLKWNGDLYTFGQDTNSYSNGRSVYLPDWGLINYRDARDTGYYYSYRPVLEVLNVDTLGADGLKDVTLELGKGTMDGKDRIHIVVKNGSTFTAPSLDGLAVPNGYNTDGFKWLGSDGKEYAPGAEVPASVTSLSAAWTPNIYTITYAPGANGTGAQETADKVHDTDLILAQALFTREGWEQTGWATTDGSGQAYELGAIYTANEAVTLYPVWKDVTEPTGELTVAGHRWSTLQNQIAFATFFKDAQEVTITAEDNSGDDVTIEYLISDKALTVNELENKTFIAYEVPFTMEPNREAVIYVKLTDKTGNVSYLSSDGLVLDNISPVIEGLEANKVYCEKQTVTITETYVDTVRVNGNPVNLDENGQFTLEPADGEQTIAVTDKAGNTDETTVTVNDGHTYEWQTEDGKYWKKCKFCGDETEKTTIPELEILGADRVCKTQNYTITFTLPKGCQDPIVGYEFTKIGGDINMALKDGVYTAVLPASSYTEEDSVKLTLSVETEDGYRFQTEKTVEISDHHIGGKATCSEKAKCEICGESYGELDANNHVHLKHMDAKAATKKAEGNTEYWYCEACEKYFADAAATKEIKKTDTVVAKLKDNSKSAQTGDHNQFALWLMLLLVSGGAFAGTTVLEKRRRK